MQSPHCQNGSFIKTSLLAAFGAFLMVGASSFLAADKAEAQQTMTCGPQYNTVQSLRDGLPDNGQALIDLTVAETDHYLAQLGRGRPENSWGKTAIIVVVPNRGAVIGMTDGMNLCSPYLRVSQRSHQAAIDAVLGIEI